MIADGRSLERAPIHIPWTWGTRIHEQMLADTLWSERERVRGLVIDLGCGMKPYAEWLGRPGRRWIGLDLPSSFTGKPKADAFSFADATPIRSGVADCVISTQVVEHVPRPWAVFAEAARMLKPGGSFIVTAPQSQWLHEEPHDYYRYTKYGLMELAKQAGLTPVRVAPIGGAFALLGFQMSAHVPMFGAREGSPWWHLRRWIQAAVQWTATRLDSALFVPEDPMGNMLVAEKR